VLVLFSFRFLLFASQFFSLDSLLIVFHTKFNPHNKSLSVYSNAFVCLCVCVFVCFIIAMCTSTLMYNTITFFVGGTCLPSLFFRYSLKSVNIFVHFVKLLNPNFRSFVSSLVKMGQNPSSLSPEEIEAMKLMSNCTY
jgi:hypothetical protein